MVSFNSAFFLLPASFRLSPRTENWKTKKESILVQDKENGCDKKYRLVRDSNQGRSANSSHKLAISRGLPLGFETKFIFKRHMNLNPIPPIEKNRYCMNLR